MNMRRLGHSDLTIGEIGLGCMSLGTDKEAAIHTVHEAMDRGVNFLDTADLYDDGRNEELVGQAIKGRRSKVILATKVGNRREAGKNVVWDASKSYIVSAVKESLRRLGTDYIDLYQLHGGTLEDPMEETIEAFEELKQSGIIRYYGISSIRPKVIQAYAEMSNIASVMSQYSILDRRPEEQVLPLLEQKGISLIARGPLARGILTDKGMDKIHKGYLNYSTDELLSLIHKIDAIVQTAKEDKASLTGVALRYPLQHSSVACIIPGASSLEQLDNNLREGNQTGLRSAVYHKLQQITHAQSYEKIHKL
ncbi:aryl-alcohol dehydrogenase-like predicted oxidoreductase [Paenibacillus shirakamiensis]|uniref:Aryl-alcohol dehydrogenase-like predicted oxidoreductase n=1 Tax=Paenibacillus shirakamiensis TaxID=1265935 RepID=A0ABS4JHM9_9BACL|nr:aldo/keto reductase [Paenibacillus shirakamiensis]MBP2001234.1 aryl-alcohol dehydrogenase-like predicted oxidoreductase [Paenibacillus shirakamiensis]